MKWLAVVVSLAAAGVAQAGCLQSQAPLRYEYRSTPPLMAAEEDAAQVVLVRADGCVAAHYPRHDIRRGDYSLQLAPSDLAGVDRQVDAAGLHRYSPEATAARVRELAQPGRDPLYVVSDENLIEFRVPDANAKQGGLRSVQVSRLRNDLMALPNDGPLLGVAAAEEVFQDLADRAQRAQEQP